MANTLEQLSAQLAALIEQHRPSVVRVVGARRRPASGTVWGPQLVITADHALRREAGLQVITDDGAALEATLVGRDPTTDLALLEVSGGPLTPAPRAESGGLAAGNLVLALGRPRERLRATLGLVSDLGGGWSTPAGGQLDAWIEVDGALPVGFSGGPLVDTGGRVLGVNTAGLIPGGTTVPWSTVDAVAARLRSDGSVRRGYLGVGVQPVRLPEVEREAAGQERGLLVTAVEDGGPAAAAGLRLGDVLLTLDGEPLASVHGLFALLGSRGGRAASATVLRGGAVIALEVTPGERPQRARRRRCG
jgi:S1-C subfamily serine protease